MLIGCSQKHIVGSIGSPTFSSLKKRALRQKGVVTWVDGRKYTAYRIRFGPDSTSWNEHHRQAASPHPLRPHLQQKRKLSPRDRQNAITVESAEIANIQFLSRSIGAFQGAGIGFVAGFLMGVIPNLAEPPGISTETSNILGPLACLVGLSIGTIVGRKDIFVIPPQTTTRAPESTILPPGDPLTKYGHQIRARAFAGVKYYKKSEDILGDGGSEDIKGNGFFIYKGDNWLAGTAVYISSGAIAIKMEGEGGIVRIPFRFIYELQVRKSNGEAWSPIWADDELALSRELGVEK